MLTDKKKKYAKARMSGMNKSRSAVEAGYAEKSAKQTAYKLENDPEVIAYRERLETKGKELEAKPQTETEAPESGQDEPPKLDGVSNEDAAVLMLRVQLHSDDERIVQGAAKTLLDYEIKLKSAGGKKGEQEKAAKAAAASGKFKPRIVG